MPASRREPRGKSGRDAAESLADVAAPSTALAPLSPARAPDRASLHEQRRVSRSASVRRHDAASPASKRHAIGLDPVARLHRNQRWCHHDAVVPQPGQQTVKSISTRTGFVAEVEATPMLAKPSNHFAQDVGAVLEYANLSYLPTAAALGNRHANRRLVHIQSDVCDIVIRPALH